ncbi:MAG: hypothetical protein RMY34_34375 [Aulosira sp. DedQUE10]|nr:hypothetical protein [Aulosira sp. DedQUE10]
MANVNGLTQLNNQEAIVEEINEEELDEVVGGFLLGAVGRVLGTTIVRVTDAVDETILSLFSIGGAP